MRSILSAIAFLFFATAANACDLDCDYSGAATTQNFSSARGGMATSTLPHPAGCERTRFCACGAAVDLWGGNGRQYRHLWPAAAWFGYARTTPAHNTVAVRRHHVMVLKRHVSGDRWIVANYNGYKRSSRLMEVSISGYAIVDPERPRYARR